MNKTVAVAGKGGVGKTTLAALMALRLVGFGPQGAPQGLAPVLAVDADPNACLDIALGVEAASSVGALREEARKQAEKGMAAGMSKQQFMEMRIAESLVEADDFDYIAMGRPEGPGCYCYANAVLKDVMAQIASNYPAVVIDNEAGLENLSRRLVPKCDLLVLVADSSRRGIETMGRIHSLAGDMGLDYGRVVMVVNRCLEPEPPAFASELAQARGADLLLAIPQDEGVAGLAAEGRPLSDLPTDNALWVAVDKILRLL